MALSYASPAEPMDWAIVRLATALPEGERGVLRAPVGVMHDAPLGTAARERHRQRGLDEFGPHVRSPMAQPTTRRLQASSTTARYSQPAHVGAYVMSATHSSSGPEAEKSRFTRSGAGRARASLFVVAVLKRPSGRALDPQAPSSAAPRASGQPARPGPERRVDPRTPVRLAAAGPDRPRPAPRTPRPGARALRGGRLSHHTCHRNGRWAVLADPSHAGVTDRPREPDGRHLRTRIVAASLAVVRVVAVAVELADRTAVETAARTPKHSMTRLHPYQRSQTQRHSKLHALVPSTPILPTRPNPNHSDRELDLQPRLMNSESTARGQCRRSGRWPYF